MDGDKPPRNMNFTDYGDGSKGGQFRPPFKQGNETYVDTNDEIGRPPKNGTRPPPPPPSNDGGENNYTKGRPRPPPPGDDPSDETMENDSVGGYGKPTKKDYNRTAGGHNTFGTYGQGESKEGLKGRGQGNCGDREMMVTVTANADMNTNEVILLEVGSYSFANADQSASFIKFSAVAILLSLLTVF
jgi:hypothetical protein